ncbi:MAG: hypothetical protein K0R16_2480 [Nitrososphaeraceae archaeon]|nr:hypothetical protein [Nitrososphaeraceae archaeon]
MLLYLNMLLWKYNLYNDAYVAKITAKRYNIYLREEKEREKEGIWIGLIEFLLQYFGC